MVGLNPQFDWTRFGGNMLQDIGVGLTQSPTLATGFGRGAQINQAQQPYRDQMATLEEERKREALEKNQTSEWIKANFPQYGNLPPAQAWQAAMGDLQAKRSAASGGSDTPASIQEWNTFSSMTPDQQGAYLRMKRATPYLDVGTGFVQPDVINPGQTSGPAIVKENFTEAYDTEAGKGVAKVDVETKAAFDSLNSKMPGLKAVVAELGTLAEQATYTTAGQLWDDVVRETGAMPTEGALARTKYMSMVDNQVLPLLRDTFGAAFTVQEGESLRATLGAPNKSPAEKKAVLEAFIEQKVRDLTALQNRVSGAGGAVDYKTEYGLE
jgi:hypothetical protein